MNRGKFRLDLGDHAFDVGGNRDVGGKPLGRSSRRPDRLERTLIACKLRATPATEAPHAASRSAMARPMPREAPVTRATWPLKSTRQPAAEAEEG